MWIEFVKGHLLGLILFVFWVEFGPNMGGILVRVDPENEKRLNVAGFVHFCFSPFWTPELWKLSFWDLNFVVVTSLMGISNAYLEMF